MVVADSGAVAGAAFAGIFGVVFLAFFWLVPARRWPFLSDEAKRKHARDRYYDPRTRKWSHEPPTGDDAATVRRVPGGRSMLRSILQTAKAEGYGRGERAFVVGWSMLGNLLPMLGIVLLVAGPATRIAGLVCLIGGLITSMIPMTVVMRARVRRRQQRALGAVEPAFTRSRRGGP